MQIKIKNISKYLIFAVLSCSFIIAMNSGIPDISNLSSAIDADDSNSASAIENIANVETIANNAEQANGANPPVAPTVAKRDSIWYQMGKEFQLDHNAQSEAVRREIRRLVSDQTELYRVLNAAAPYMYFIHNQTKARGLPAELGLIPFIESEFNPNDHSNKGATGIWQLMAGTADELGVKVTPGYDGRRNIPASTKAALAYFKDLGNNFDGNWYLAIAAYNCGQGKVESAVRRTGSHNFWNLPLPTETKYYVPRLLAIAEIVKHPEKYGVKLPPLQNKPYFAEVKVDNKPALTKVAKKSGIDIKVLKKLNPDYNNGYVPKKEGTYTLLVPVNKASTVTTTKV
ncbi:MAG: hypothetical protein A3F14_00495 [Gammaproteobacteria bacterium RIFCSPHIGHO2_12_FULL_43_28]|nr:MAG: hypothetical protein A3F14_00495 [Gammaproteobacteria bacterium RIFCSPHIGHO2_12_FULL_43_28]